MGPRPRYSSKTGKRICTCKMGIVSAYDGKCGHCRSTKEQKNHVWKPRHWDGYKPTHFALTGEDTK